MERRSTYLSKGAWCHYKHIDGIYGHDKYRRQRHKPADHFTPCWELVVQIFEGFVLDETEETDTLVVEQTKHYKGCMCLIKKKKKKTNN